MAKSKKVPPRFERLADFGAGLQGVGAAQTAHVRALRGSKLGPASAGRRLTAAERRAVEEQMRRDGKL